MKNPYGELSQQFFIEMENGNNYDYIVFTTKRNCCSENCLVPKLVPVSELKVGDLIRTNVGDQKLSKIIKTLNNFDRDHYIKFAKNCFNNNIPSEDVFITSYHPLSIGYFDVKDINNGVPDPEQDEKVIVQISAGELVNKLPGITEVVEKSSKNYNLLFDKHCSMNMSGLDVVNMHPVGNDVYNNPTLQDKDYQDPENATKKQDKPFYINYKNLLTYKPKDMELAEFLGKCFTANEKDKFKFEKINPNHNRFRNKFNIPKE